MTGIQIACLADYPDFAPQLAEWFYEEWGRIPPAISKDLIEQRLQERMNRNKIPITYVALSGSEPVGSASLKIREMTTHPQYEFWLGSVYVRSDVRGQGIGTKLVEYSASEAARFGVHQLYIQTENRESFYARLGWDPVERPIYRGKQVVIMKRRLG